MSEEAKVEKPARKKHRTEWAVLKKAGDTTPQWMIVGPSDGFRGLKAGQKIALALGEGRYRVARMGPEFEVREKPKTEPEYTIVP